MSTSEQQSTARYLHPCAKAALLLVSLQYMYRLHPICRCIKEETKRASQPDNVMPGTVVWRVTGAYVVKVAAVAVGAVVRVWKDSCGCASDVGGRVQLLHNMAAAQRKPGIKSGRQPGVEARTRR